MGTISIGVTERKFADFLSLRPNKLVSYSRVIKPSRVRDVQLQSVIPGPEKIRNVNKHNFELSRNAQKNIQEKITWLYHFSKKKTITTSGGKIISDFKMNFATLTLPSVQAHSSDFITKNCLNQLFVELNKKMNFKNYVWRLEYQKNGNIHYHLATDVFINYYLLRNIWNRILQKYGYITAYQDKFNSMTLMDYVRNYSNAENTNFKELQERYAKGCRENWQNPHSVDVKVCTNSRAVAFYISKYFGKNSATGSQNKLPVNEDNSGNSRLWYCSTSLSKLKFISDVRHAFEVDFLGFMYSAKKVKKIVCDYCTVYYFNISDLCHEGYRAFAKLFQDYGRYCCYLDPLPV
jgi:hypothetical protein